MAKSYESDITRFLRELQERNPQIAQGQREGRAMFWDRNLDSDLYQRFEQSDVPQPAYVYQPASK